MMRADAILLNNNDNVITTVKDVTEGEAVSYFKGSELCSIVVTADIPACHKIALMTILKGDLVIKYGEVIGRATQEIPLGGWASHENIESLPREYDTELQHSYEEDKK